MNVGETLLNTLKEGYSKRPDTAQRGSMISWRHLPLFFLQPMLRRIMRVTVQRRPELFARLGTHKNKRFLVNPTNLPFAFLLCPDLEQPVLRACRHPLPAHDAQIQGTFLTLFDMIDGRLDGDALFFSRDLAITGDIEAVVVLRNALDDLEGSIADDLAASYGLPAKAALAALRRIKRGRHEKKA